MTTKICSKCKQESLLQQFVKDKRYKDGYGSWCKSCRRSYQNKWQREWRKYNPERAKEIARKCREKSPDSYRKHRFLSLYGITIDEYNSIFLKQEGVCAICGEIETQKNQYKTKSLSVDHDHKTNEVRGLLCSRCNRLLGKIENNLELVNKCLKYLL